MEVQIFGDSQETLFKTYLADVNEYYKASRIDSVQCWNTDRYID